MKKKTLATIVSAGMIFGIMGTAIPVAQAQNISNLGVNTENRVTDARSNPYDYTDRLIVENGVDNTTLGTVFSPEFLKGESSEVTFKVIRGLNDKGEDITNGLNINPRTGDITITRNIANVNSDFFYFEVTGTYFDGSTLNDKVFVVNEKIVNNVTKEDLIAKAENKKNSTNKRNEILNKINSGQKFNIDSEIARLQERVATIDPVAEINNVIDQNQAYWTHEVNNFISQTQQNWNNGVNATINNLLNGYAEALKAMGHSQEHVDSEIARVKVQFNLA